MSGQRRLIVEHREVGLNRRMLPNEVHRRPTGALPAFAGRRQVPQGIVPVLSDDLVAPQEPKSPLGGPVAEINVVPVRPPAARVLEPTQRGKCLAAYAEEASLTVYK